MINIKHAVTAVATVVAAGAAVAGCVRAHKTKNPITEAVESFYSPEFIAFNKATRITSDRMLAGRYDDWTDAQVRSEYDVLYANFLKK